MTKNRQIEPKGPSVSLYPLSFEEAVERILQSPPPPKLEKSKRPRRAPQAKGIPAHESAVG